MLYNTNLSLRNFTMSKAKLCIWSKYIYIFALIFQCAYHFCAIFITPMALNDLVKGTTIYNVFLCDSYLKLSTQEQFNDIYT
jgi:hypothetical protein